MFPYWLLFGIFAVGALLVPREQGPLRSSSSPLLALAALFMALLIGLRFQVGADWSTYEWLFTVAGRATLDRVITLGDPGYQLLNWAIRQLGGAIWQVNLVCALIFGWGLLRLAQVQSQPWLAMVVAVDGAEARS